MSNFLKKKYHTEVIPIMMIPGLTYLMTNNVLPIKPTEIIFSCWEYLPTNEQLTVGVKMYFILPDDNDNKEEYIVVYKNRRGAFAGDNNIKFYKDYGNIIEY
jgi:hypothetical protein